MLDIHLQQNNTASLSHSLPLLLLLTHTNNSKNRVCPFSSKASFQRPLGNLCRDRCILFLSIMHSTPHICKAWHHHRHNSTHLHRTPNLRQSQFPLNVHKHKQQKNNNAILKKLQSPPKILLLSQLAITGHHNAWLQPSILAKVSRVILCLGIIHLWWCHLVTTRPLQWSQVFGYQISKNGANSLLSPVATTFVILNIIC